MKYAHRILTAFVALAFPGIARSAPQEPLPRPEPGRVLTVQDLLVAALRANLELQSKRIDPKIHQAEVAAAWGAFDPTFAMDSYSTYTNRAQNEMQYLSTGEISYIYNENLIHDEVGFNGKLPFGTQYTISASEERSSNTFNQQSSSRFHPEYTAITTFGITQPLLRDLGFAANLAEVRLHASETKVSNAELRGTLIKVVAQVSEAYFEMVFGQENLKVKQEAVELAQNLVRESQRRAEEGKMSQLDVTQARERESEAKEELLLAENFLSQRRNTLQELTRENFDAGDSEWAVDGSALLRAVPEVDRAGLIKDLFDSNPRYIAALQAAKTEDVRIAYAKNQRWPRVDLKASLGWNGLNDYWGPAFTDFRNRTGPNWSAGVVVEIPLTGRTGRAHYSQEKLRKVQALLEVKHTEVTLLSAFDTAIRNLQTAKTRVILVRQSVVLAEEACHAEEKRLLSGLTTSFNVATTQKDLSLARSRELATFVDLNKAVVELYSLLGTLPDIMHVHVDFN